MFDCGELLDVVTEEGLTKMRSQVLAYESSALRLQTHNFAPHSLQQEQKLKGT